MLVKLLVTFLLISNPMLVWLNRDIYDEPLKSAHANLASLTAKETLSDQSTTTPIYELPLANTYVQAQANPDFLPIRNWSIEEIEPDAQAAIVFDTDKDKILYQKHIDEVLPIASLTKLMTAVLTVENLKLDRVVNVSKTAYDTPGKIGNLKVDEKMTVKTLMHALLMESSNDAAVALAEAFDLNNFISLMNQKAKDLGMTQTVYVDPSGIGPENVSNINDLIKLLKYALQHKIIWEILSTPVAYLQSADGQYDHRFVNNNSLLSRIDNVVGGKTGYTDEARGCMILVTSKPSQKNLITIVLGSSDRMMTTEKLIDWANKAYVWQP